MEELLLRSGGGGGGSLDGGLLKGVTGGGGGADKIGVGEKLCLRYATGWKPKISLYKGFARGWHNIFITLLLLHLQTCFPLI